MESGINNSTILFFFLCFKKIIINVCCLGNNNKGDFVLFNWLSLKIKLKKFIFDSIKKCQDPNNIKIKHKSSSEMERSGRDVFGKKNSTTISEVHTANFYHSAKYQRVFSSRLNVSIFSFVGFFKIYFNRVVWCCCFIFGDFALRIFCSFKMRINKDNIWF